MTIHEMAARRREIMLAIQKLTQTLAATRKDLEEIEAQLGREMGSGRAIVEPGGVVLIFNGWAGNSACFRAADLCT